MFEVVFLLCLGFVWILFASIQDCRKTEIANWLNFSLVVFALGFRVFYSLFNGGFDFFYQGLIGFGIFFVIGNLFYYGRLFAGGDAKLMIVLGSVLALSDNFFINLKVYLVFLLLFLFVGAIYGILWSIYLAIKYRGKFSKAFKEIFISNKVLIYIVSGIAILFFIIGIVNWLYFFIGVFLIGFLFLYFFIKAIDEGCMIRKVLTKDLTEGDWLSKDVKINKKIIKAHWEGLELDDIKLLQKNKKYVLVKRGIVYAPVFLFSFIILILGMFGLLKLFWIF